MNNDFQATFSARKERILRIKNLVDLVELEREQTKQNDLEYDPLSASSSSTTQTIAFESGTFLRKLIREEQQTLKNLCICSCTNDDWSRIYLLLPAASAVDITQDKTSDFSLDLKQLVSNTHFDGFVVLDLTIENDVETNIDSKSSHWYALPPGLHSNTYVADSIIRVRNCRVYKNSFVSRTFIGAKVVLMNCGQVSSCPEEIGSYGRMNITVGAESGGGRSLSLIAESTMVDVCRQLRPSYDKTESDPASLSSVLPFPFNVLSHGSVLFETSKLQNVFLYPYSLIEAASSVTNSTLFNNAQITTGSVVSNVLMQWNATISGNSNINNVLMMEHSHLGPLSIVESVVMGPDSHASAGEIHASIIGPSTNAHHQSLLIGILWPLGRGNVAYGANVGSNHTGRLPDQECTVGEGVFWGLSCVVKFPTDLSLAPYSMIAAGTKLTPQRITMPFSLIMESSSCEKNDIVPGWVLQHTPYTLARNDKKFATRRKASRHAFYTGWKILRPATVEMCRIARSVLRKTEGDSSSFQGVSGIGECRLTERARDGGIIAYSNCIQLYALRGLLSWLQEKFDKAAEGETSISIGSILQENVFAIVEAYSLVNDSPALEWPPFPWELDDLLSKKHEWEYQLRLLVEEFPTKTDKHIHDVVKWIQTLLSNLLRLEKDLADRIAKCKRRDDTRGVAIIPGYADSHVLAETDPVIISAWEEQKMTEQVVQRILTRITYVS